MVHVWLDGLISANNRPHLATLRWEPLKEQKHSVGWLIGYKCTRVCGTAVNCVE